MPASLFVTSYYHALIVHLWIADLTMICAIRICELQTMNKNLLAVAMAVTFSSSTFAGGILLHEVATFDSVSSAGVGNSSNRTDASAVITSPAGLTVIDDNSFSIGVQYLNAKTEHSGTGVSVDKSTTGESNAFIPSLAYAQRINDSWVIGASLHGEGGLSMDYSGGLVGPNGGLPKTLSDEALNLQLAAGFQASDNLSLGGALIVQHLMTSFELGGDSRLDGDGSSTAASFMLSAMYDVSDSTFLSANYKHKVKHNSGDIDVSFDGNQFTSIERNASWPAQLDFGLQHKISDELTFKAMTGVEFWSQFDDAANNVYSLGTALAYSQNDWTYQGGIRYDSKMYDTDKMTPALPIGANWSLGLGAEKERSNGHRIGIAYQYRNMGTQDVTYTGPTDTIPYFTGSVDTNRIHVLSISYAY
ncbi:putative long-chain fatty acid transport protein [Vibrio mediterranei AK1]|nr:putative long-chain fatty acid transport protein [Vibrio mediterranei AK1]